MIYDDILDSEFYINVESSDVSEDLLSDIDDDAYREAVKATYAMLRTRNLFTHRIAYPEVKAFVTVPANDIPLESIDFGGRIAEKYKYNHSADASIEVFRTVSLSRLYMPEEEYNKIEQLSVPVLLNLYRLTGEKD